jgi:4-amino-4-deoxy-L-arabinose transferase-like glycosyltransferase
MMGIANAVLILLLYLQAKKLLGQSAAFLGAGLMAFAPFLLGDSRTMRGDALMSSLMLLSVFLFLRFLRERHWTTLATSALCLGLAILTKIAAIPVLGVAGLAVTVVILRDYHRPWAERLRWGLTTLGIWAGLVLLTLILLWPALWVVPAEVLQLVRVFAVSAIDGRTTYFRGQLFEGDVALPLFYPVSFLFRANPIVVLGVVVMTLVMMSSAWYLLQRLRQPRSPLSPPPACWSGPRASSPRCRKR